MSDIGRELHLMLQASVREALARRHASVTVAHLLYAMLHDPKGGEILLNCGADVGGLKAALERFFDEDLEEVPGDEPFESQQTLAFHRVLQNTCWPPSSRSPTPTRSRCCAPRA
jgi:ATP-dependent Clp protease ATP-binding subunit ClpA